MTRPKSKLSGLLRVLGLGILYGLGLASIIATGGGGGGGGGDSAAPPVNRAPMLSNLTLSPNSVDFLAGGGRETIEVIVNYSDPEADITSIRVEVSNGSSLTIPVPSPLPGTSGQLIGELELSTDVAGVHTAQVWALDRAGNSSNRLSATLTVRGNARLSDLSYSAGELDQVFQPALMDYTGTVSVLKSTTAITATTEDPDATVTVGGMAVESGTASGKITLDQGDNEIIVVVTASDQATTATYTIDVTRKTASDLLQEVYIKADNPKGGPRPGTPVFLGYGDLFGSAIAFDDDTLAVGAWGQDSAEGWRDWGTVYLFARDQGGVWNQEAKLTTPDSLVSDVEPHFGVNVALAGDTLFIAEIRSEISVNFHSPGSFGHIHTFSRNPSGAWNAQDTIVPTRPFNPNAFSQFGIALSAQNDTLVVGDPLGRYEQMVGDDPQDIQDREGDAFIFGREANNTWNQVLRFVGPSPDIGDRLGAAVAVDTDTIAVGAPGEDSAPIGITGDPFDNSTVDAGAVFVLRRLSGDVWAQEALLKAPNGESGDQFGGAVALSEDTLVVSAYGEDSGAKGIDGDQGDNGSADSGALYVFSRAADGSWNLEAYIKASNTGIQDQFGFPTGFVRGASLSLQGDTLVVGANREDSIATGVNGDELDDSAEDAGAVYVFTRDANRTWTQVAYIKASNTDPHDRFGAVALIGESIAVGAPGEASASGGVYADQSNNDTYGDAGAVYVFR